MSSTPSAEERRDRQDADGEDRLRLIIDRTPDGIVVVGSDGLIRFANPAAEPMFGRSAPELIGEQFGFPITADETTEVDILRKGGGTTVVESICSTIAGPPKANSNVCSWPTSTLPASFRRRMTVASCGGKKLASLREFAVVRSPAT